MTEFPLTPINLSGLTYKLIYSDKLYEKNTSVIDEAHIHDHYEIYLNISGDVNFLVNGNIYPIKSGDIVLTRPNELHYCIYKRTCICEHFCLWISVDKASTVLKDIDNSSANLYSLADDKRAEIVSLFYKLKDSTADSLYSTSLLLQIIQIFSLDYPHNDTYTGALPDSMQDILRYINFNYPDIININQIYDIFHISAPTLNRWFKKYINLSPKAYLESIKLSNARQMLNSGASVTEACYGCGYTDCSHFIKVFKNNIGQTPLQYKNNE